MLLLSLPCRATRDERRRSDDTADPTIFNAIYYVISLLPLLIKRLSKVAAYCLIQSTWSLQESVLSFLGSSSTASEVA